MKDLLAVCINAEKRFLLGDLFVWCMWAHYYVLTFWIANQSGFAAFGGGLCLAAAISGK